MHTVLNNDINDNNNKNNNGNNDNCNKNTCCPPVVGADHMDREKVSKWLSRLDEMNDEDGQMERMYYLKYLVSTLSTSFGLEEPFTALPPHTVQKLSQILPPAVFAELLDRNEETAEPLLSRKPFGSQKPVGERRPLIEHHDYNDRLFFEQQLFPPEGLICYAAAFSALPDRSDED